MSVGNQRLDIPSLEDIMSQFESMNVSPELIDAITNYALLIRLQTELGGLGLQQGQQDLQSQQTDLGFAQVDFQKNYQLPFQQQQLENDRILAELGIEGRNIDLQSQRELAAIQAEQAQAQLAQIREIGGYDAFQNDIAKQTALINLARQREDLAANSIGTRRGSGQFTPRGISGSTSVR